MDQQVEPYVHAGFFMSRVVNPIVIRFGLTNVLVVRGRRSGRPVSTPLGRPLEFEGGRYLVSGRGETHWVRNLRTAGRGEFRFHGRTEPFRAVEIRGAEHDRIVDAYRRAHGHAVDGLFARIPDPADHPVFRLEADTAEAERAT
jgi:deazaflavin-dependent oxidoreductase (nitroreductase family)